MEAFSGIDGGGSRGSGSWPPLLLIRTLGGDGDVWKGESWAFGLGRVAVRGRKASVWRRVVAIVWW